MKIPEAFWIGGGAIEWFSVDQTKESYRNSARSEGSISAIRRSDDDAYFDLQFDSEPLFRAMPTLQGLVSSEDGRELSAGMYLGLADAARICFDETSLYGDFPVSGESRLHWLMVQIIMEAQERPELISLWGVQVPGTKLKRIPPSDIETCAMYPDYEKIWVEESQGRRVEWDQISVLSSELPAFIERLRAKTTVGQQTISTVDFEKWDNEKQFTLWQVAWLWANQEPRPQGQSLPNEARTAYRKLEAAIKSRKLELSWRPDIHEAAQDASDTVLHGISKSANPNWTVTREALRNCAHCLGEKPLFLFPRERTRDL